MDLSTVERAVAASDWAPLLSWLRALSAEERAMARPAYHSRWRAAARQAAESRGHQPRIVQLALAIGLSETPLEANKNCAWGRRLVRSDPDDALAQLTALLFTRGGAWAVEFAGLAGSTSVRGESLHAAAEVAALVLPVYDRVNTEIPEGAIPTGWAQIVQSASVATPETSSVPIWLSRHSPSGADVGDEVPTSLSVVLAATRRLPDVLVAALRTPNAMCAFAGFTRGDWDLVATIRDFVTRGVLKRSSLINEALAALARSDRAGAQRVMVAILRGADFGGQDAASRLSLVAHLMPTVHGSVTAVLLPAALEAGPSDDVLCDIGSVILARKEKSQKTALVRDLARMPLTPAVESVLGIAAADPDATLATAARRALGEDSKPTAHRSDDAPWSLPVDGYRPGPLASWSTDAAGLDAARSDSEVLARITSNAMTLDLAVRYAQLNLPSLREAVQAGPAPMPLWWWSGHTVLPLLHGWCSTGSSRRSYAVTRTKWVRGADGSWREDGKETVNIPPPPHQEFTERLIEETLDRLGTIPELLSTPSRDDGSIAVADLEGRLRRARKYNVGAYDLVQALLRLEPVAVAAAERFAKLSAPVVASEQRWCDKKTAALDGGQVVAEWIRAGGLPAKHVLVDQNGVRTEQAVLPLPPELSDLDGVNELLAAVNLVNRERVQQPRMALHNPSDVCFYLGVAPYWTDAAAALLEVAGVGDSVDVSRALPTLAASPGRVGVGAHRLVARLLSHPRQDARLMTIETMATLAGQGRLDGDMLREATLALLSESAVSITRLADAWENASRVGLLSWIWPSMAGVLDAALSSDRAPTGLAELIRVLSGTMASVSRDEAFSEVLSRLQQLAAGRSSSKASQEARALISSLEGVPQ